jgi:rod shape-determining protein MreC
MRDTGRTRLVLALLLLAAFAMITIDFGSGSSSPLNPLRRLGSEVFGPVERGVAAISDPVADAFNGLTHFYSSQQRIEALERENSRLRSRLLAGKLDEERTKELEGLLDLAGRGRYRIVPAGIVGFRGGQGFEYTATIDVGSRDGIERNMTVVNADGLVGRVTHVARTTSTVLLAVDGTSSVGVRLEGSEEIGIAEGSGRQDLRLDLLNSGTNLRPGERLVTFGSQGGVPYVPGVPVGTVVQVNDNPGSLTTTATVRPFVNFSGLNLVGVVREPPRKNPRDAVLPPAPPGSSPSPKPSPSPSPSPTSSTGTAARGSSPETGTPQSALGGE